MVDTPCGFCFLQAVEAREGIGFWPKEMVGFLASLVQDAVDVGGKLPFSFLHGGASET